jgi:hypothetical protein
MYVAPPFSHACSAFAVALFTYVWLRVRDDWSPPPASRRWGAAGALMAMTREQDVFFIAGPAWTFGLGFGKFPRLFPKPESLEPESVRRSRVLHRGVPPRSSSHTRR